jgi:peptidoglycan/LPS O-acetylase OafA/YrhL
MELIAAVLIAGPLGYFVQTRTRMRGIALYLVVWAVIFPIQTVVVHAENPDDIEPIYFIINALILAGGIGLHTLGARLRERRQRAASVWPRPSPRGEG